MTSEMRMQVCVEVIEGGRLRITWIWAWPPPTRTRTFLDILVDRRKSRDLERGGRMHMFHDEDAEPGRNEEGDGEVCVTGM